MPDARDLPALLLCADAAIRGSEAVRPVEAVAADSLTRIAGLRLHIVDADGGYHVPVARRWNSDSVALNPDWCAWIRQTQQIAALDWAKLCALPPGGQALTVALATAPSSIAASKVAVRCGTQVAERFRMHQQIKRWLKRMEAAGFDEWAFDSVTGVLFRVARIDPAMPIPPWVRFTGPPREPDETDAGDRA
ncbi:hypothetical protein Hoch_6371 [Haliangium ochraceum DSM 14365]|uniref:Uncharacterized protein n=2 Tax=Haliangium ochraceum TaxID=80816 RepID=D0LP15_HALO1|nr:hypothetical protein Hoch_6371 [Haliangium ochraceum DSM 14365]